VAAEIPVGIGFATDAGAAGGEFALVGGGVGVVAQAFAGGPMDELEDGAERRGMAVGKSISRVVLEIQINIAAKAPAKVPRPLQGPLRGL